MKIQMLLEKARFELPTTTVNIPTRKLLGEALAQIEAFRERIIISLDWMVTSIKWKHNETKLNEEGFEGEYSPELKEAIKLLEELKGKNDGV